MPLTPQDVRSKLFTSVRFRPGYDEDEVDSFLDEVEQELTTLHAQIDELRSGSGSRPSPTPTPAGDGGSDARARSALDEATRRHDQELAALRSEHAAALSAARDEKSSGGGTEQDLRRRLQEAETQREEQAKAHRQQVRDLESRAQQAQAAADEARRQADRQPTPLPVRGETPPSYLEGYSTQDLATGPLPPPSPAEDALRRTLLLAQRTADEAIAQARAEAHQIVGEAHQHATDKVRQAELDHAAVMERAQTEYDDISGKLEELRGFERDYRSRLRAYLHLQLRDLEAGAPEPAAQVGAGARNALPERTAEVDHSGADVDLRPSPLYGKHPDDDVEDG